jgi:hypothetical protein
MKLLLSFQLALTVLGTIMVWIFALEAAGLSFGAGASVTLFNLAVLVFGWPRILAQKQVALAILAIIFKFAILGCILYLAAHSPSLQMGWFAFGLATVFPSLLVAAFNLETVHSDLGASS